MKKYKLVFILLLWSRCGFSSVISTLRPISPEIKNTYSLTQFETIIANMPRVRSQDSLGVCFGFSSATVVQHYACLEQKSSCNPLDEMKEISPMSMVAWANPNDPNKRAGTWTNHSNIRFSGLGYGALGHFALDKNNMTFSESCYPFDQLANRYSDDKEAIETIVEKLKAEYDRFKTEGSTCEECLLKLVQKDLGAKTTLRDLAIGLKQKTFEQFLYTAFVGSCESGLIAITPPAKMNMFPKQNETANYKELLGEIKKVLSLGRPLILDSVCPYYENNKCTGGHSVVITGYRSICKKDNPKDCRDVLKIQNSWGEDWQKRNDDGWLDAKILLGDKPFSEGAVSWLTPQ